MLNTLSTFVAQILLHISPATGALLNYVPPGPMAILFSIIYQYSRVVPSVYELKIFGIAMTDKIWVYATAIQVSFQPSKQCLQVPNCKLIYTYTACVVICTGFYFYSIDWIGRWEHVSFRSSPIERLAYTTQVRLHERRSKSILIKTYCDVEWCHLHNDG